jgi:phage protein U
LRLAYRAGEALQRKNVQKAQKTPIFALFLFTARRQFPYDEVAKRSQHGWALVQVPALQTVIARENQITFRGALWQKQLE